MRTVCLFDKVILKPGTAHANSGMMVVREIRTPEQADYYGSYEIICRYVDTGEIRDFKESELLVVEERTWPEDGLSKFCREILAALDGENETSWLSTSLALCGNAACFDREHGTRVDSELSYIFGGNRYPFNRSAIEHIQEGKNGKYYENQARLSFLKKHAQET